MTECSSTCGKAKPNDLFACAQKNDLAFRPCLDKNQDMVETVSLDALTDEEIENLSMRRIKAAVGNTLDLVGSTDPNHHETPATCECTLCRNGQRLDKAGKAVCLRCSRASKQVDRIIESVKAEERILQSIAAKQRIDMIKARAAAQRMGRRGAKLNPIKKKIVMQGILDRLCENEQ